MSEAEVAPAPVGDPDNGVMTCDQAYTKAGGFGRYQIFTLIILAISLNGPGMVTYGIARKNYHEYFYKSFKKQGRNFLDTFKPISS